MNITELFALPERRLQHLVRLLLSDTHTIRYTTLGKPLQVVSPGEWNALSGPDFRNMAVLVDGCITIGHGEFHRRSSDWLGHGHIGDPAYDCVLLHIVLQDNTAQLFAEHTLVVEARELLALAETMPEPDNTAGGIAAEELQDYAYRRLLRKTASASELVRSSSAVEAFLRLVQQYAGKRRKHKQRPGGRAALSAITGEALLHSKLVQLLAAVEHGEKVPHLYRTMTELSAEKWIDCGVATRMELLVNALLPVALSTAGESARYELLAWYWSQRAVQQYRSLQRRYPATGQEYIWKQQGLLEYAAQQNFGTDRVAESISAQTAFQIWGAPAPHTTIVLTLAM